MSPAQSGFHHDGRLSASENETQITAAFRQCGDWSANFGGYLYTLNERDGGRFLN